jgi:hypothetical protein
VLARLAWATQRPGVQESEVLEVLLGLAAEAGMRVKVAGQSAASGDSPAPASGVCRVRGELWVILSNLEPASSQIRVLAAAIRTHASTLVDERHLPPAVRALLEG